MTTENQETTAAPTGPRVTKEHLESLIVGEFYATADKAFAGDQPVYSSMMKHTLCMLVLQSGFTVLGQSVCASEFNFDPLKGQVLARADAIDKLADYEGYMLRHAIWQQQNAQVAA